jgi:hypothetical protein
MLTVHLIAVLLSQTPDSALGDVGESCRARSDCRSGLRCVNAQCAAPVAQTKEGQACEATSDCSADGSLRCVARVCRMRGAVSMAPAPDASSGSSTARLTEAPPTPARSATLMDSPPPQPSPMLANGLTVSQQIMSLERDIDSINFDLRRIQTGWPAGSTALVVIGALLSPLAVIGLILLPASIVAGLVVLAVGGGGIAMIIAGATGGARASSDAMAERNSLLERRSNAERELATLRRTAAATEPPSSALLTLLAF